MARRSRPPTLLTLGRRLIRRQQLVQPGQHVLCACSGGPDSTALLHLLSLLQAKLDLRLSALGIDHGLRPEADAELDHARAVAAAHDIAFATVRLSLPPGSNLQARARQARLLALRDAARRAGAQLIALGHTADDRAETVLIRLLRGAGPRGLAAMAPVAPLPLPADARAPAEEAGLRVIRPLLLARRADVLTHLERHKLGYSLDPSNLDGRFLRVRIRRQLLPLMEQLSPGIVGHLCALAEMLAEELAGDPLAGLPRTQRQMIRQLLERGGGSVSVRLRGGQDLHLRLSRPAR